MLKRMFAWGVILCLIYFSPAAAEGIEKMFLNFRVMPQYTNAG